MFEQRQQRHRRESRLRRFRQQDRNAPARYAPAAGRRNRRSPHPSAPVRRRRGAPGRGRASPARRCGLPFPASGAAPARSPALPPPDRARDQGEAVKTLRQFRRRPLGQGAPGIGGGRRAQAFAQQCFARRVGAAAMPIAHVFASPRRSVPAIASCRIADGRDRARSSFFVQLAVQAGQHHRAIGQACDHAKQPRGGGNGAGRAGRDHHAVRRILLQPLRQQRQRAIAPRRRISTAFRLSSAGQCVLDQVQKPRDLLPMLRQAPAAPSLSSSREIGALAFDFVHHVGQSCRPGRRPGRNSSSRRAAYTSQRRIKRASSNCRRMGAMAGGRSSPSLTVSKANRLPRCRPGRGIAAAVPPRPAPGRRLRQSRAPHAGSADRW